MRRFLFVQTCTGGGMGLCTRVAPTWDISILGYLFHSLRLLGMMARTREREIHLVDRHNIRDGLSAEPRRSRALVNLALLLCSAIISTSMRSSE
jgi:hypothetical protein